MELYLRRFSEYEIGDRGREEGAIVCLRYSPSREYWERILMFDYYRNGPRRGGCFTSDPEYLKDNFVKLSKREL